MESVYSLSEKTIDQRVADASLRIARAILCCAPRDLDFRRMSGYFTVSSMIAILLLVMTNICSHNGDTKLVSAQQKDTSSRE